MLDVRRGGSAGRPVPGSRCVLNWRPLYAVAARCPVCAGPLVHRSPQPRWPRAPSRALRDQCDPCLSVNQPSRRPRSLARLSRRAHPRSCRALDATHLHHRRNAGASLRDVQDFLFAWHADPRTTRRYDRDPPTPAPPTSPTRRPVTDCLTFAPSGSGVTKPPLQTVQQLVYDYVKVRVYEEVGMVEMRALRPAPDPLGSYFARAGGPATAYCVPRSSSRRSTQPAIAWNPGVER